MTRFDYLERMFGRLADARMRAACSNAGGGGSGKRIATVNHEQIASAYKAAAIMIENSIRDYLTIKGGD